MKKIKIYPIQYLEHEDLTDDDLYILFNTPSLLYSLINAEFILSGYDMSQFQISKIIKKKNWQYSYFWDSMVTEDRFERMLMNVFHNIHQCGPVESKSRMEWFIIQYGLSNPKLEYNKHNNFLVE